MAVLLISALGTTLCPDQVSTLAPYRSIAIVSVIVCSVVVVEFIDPCENRPAVVCAAAGAEKTKIAGIKSHFGVFTALFWEGCSLLF